MVNSSSGMKLGDEGFVDGNGTVNTRLVVVCRAESKCTNVPLRQLLVELSRRPSALHDVLEWRREILQDYVLDQSQRLIRQLDELDEADDIDDNMEN